jgi:hypothetical protein
MRKEETLKERLEKFDYACYTEICTMNSPENTEYEKGYMAGIGSALELGRRYFSEKEDE